MKKTYIKKQNKTTIGKKYIYIKRKEKNKQQQQQQQQQREEKRKKDILHAGLFRCHCVK